jgi:two-component system response regulator AtoC
MKSTVLVVDDEASFRVLAEQSLLAEGFEVRVVSSLSRARQELQRAAPDIVVLDRRLPDGDGMDLLRETRAEGTSAPQFVIVTGYADLAHAVEAVQAGAADYLAKPVQPTDLVMKLRKALEVRGLRDQLALVKGRSDKGQAAPQSVAMRGVSDALREVSRSPSTPVLLVGPSGSGKQFAAEQLHALSHEGARDAPFVDVNCAALAPHLVDSELFWHERGAFTDARSARRGLIELADGGTLFLDEIAELPESSQAKLLKFLDSMRFRRVGGEREIEVSLRVVAATNQDLDKLLKAGRFRLDLYHRLAVFLVKVPSLAERRAEVPELARIFVRQYAARLKKRADSLSPDALAALEKYDFPGNVRELRNIIERAVILARGAQIDARDIVLSSQLGTGPSASGSEPFFRIELEADGHLPPADAVERAYVLRVLEHLQGRRLQAAQALGMSYPTFLKRLRELGVDDG